MSIESIKIKAGSKVYELTLNEARELKSALDDIIPSKQTFIPHGPIYTLPSPPPPPPQFDWWKPTCTGGPMTPQGSGIC
jgi:hypothetical protein